MEIHRQHMNLDEEARLVLRDHINAALAALPPGTSVAEQNRVVAKVALDLSAPNPMRTDEQNVRLAPYSMEPIEHLPTEGPYANRLVPAPEGMASPDGGFPPPRKR